MFRDMTNADRAARAETALIAYIDATGDAHYANEFDTWVGDLMCDLRHLCRFRGVEFDPDAGSMNFEAECKEDEDGDYIPVLVCADDNEPVDKAEKLKALLREMLEHLDHNAPIHPGAYITAEDKPIEEVIRNTLGDAPKGGEE